MTTDRASSHFHSVFHHLRAFLGLSATTAILALVVGCGSGHKSATQALTIATTSLPNGQVGVAYSATLSATGGAMPYSWSTTSGTLPAGLSLNASTGAISGTPTTAVAATPLTFSVSDASSPVQTRQVSLTLTIAAAGASPLSITTTSLPNGQVGTAYSTTLDATGGTTPYTWSLTSGTLPSGLSLNASTGVLSGTPTASVSARALGFTVTDAGSPAQTKQVSLTLTIAPAPLAITTSSLPSGQVGVAFSTTLAATGGTTPYTWSLTSGTLPAGLSLNATTGVLSGTPTAAVTARALGFTVTDAGSPVQTKQVSLALTIAPATLVVSTTSLPNGQVGVAYNATLAATGGTTPYTWSLTSGTLPAGVTFNGTTGVLAGTPTATANATPLTFTVTDAGSPVQTKQVNLTLTIAPANVSITTSSLPNGRVTHAYSTTLAATGGTTPYAWSITSGTLPAGLSLNGATGIISGTPTATANATPLTIKVVDSSSPAKNATFNTTLTVAPAVITLTVTPTHAAIVTTQALQITPTTNDPAGVKWTCTGTGCGSFSPTTTLTGAASTYTAPSTAGNYTITATSVTDATITATVTAAVTNLAAVATYHNNLSRNGANTQEYALTTTNVATATFGKLFSCTVDGAVYAQPLWVSNLTINSVKHNVVFVATQGDSLYAFDADKNTSPCTPLWHANLIDSAHGGTTGETTVPYTMVGQGSGDILPEIGVTGTPVIDTTTNTLYVVSKSVIQSSSTFFQRLHAIDITTGNEKFSGPALVAGTYPGTGDGGSTTTFVAQQELQRAGLALTGGVVYVAWASHEDAKPFYGWLIGYNASNLTQTKVFNVDPNGGEGGIWMSGGAPAADAVGNLFLITGNGNFDATSATAPNNDYGDSFLKMATPGLTVSSYFTPSDQAFENTSDRDFGSGGATVLVDIPVNGSNPTHLVIGGGKDGTLYMLNRDSLGGSGDSNAWQMIVTNGYIFSTGAFWNSNFYIAPVAKPLTGLTLDPTTAKMSFMSTVGASNYGFPGATPSVSSAPDYTNGIVWTIDSSAYCTTQSTSCGPAILHAYNANNLASELWNSTQGTGNAAGNAVKFTVPTIANGRVYIGTRGNNTGGADSSTSIPGELDVYGLLP